MKTHTILFILFMGCFSIHSNSQARIGLKAGVNISPILMEINGIKSNTKTSQIGYHVGGVIEYQLIPNFLLQPEILLLYSSAQYAFDNDYDYETGEIITNATLGKVSFYELQLPVNLKYNTALAGVPIYVTGGPYLGFIVYGKDSPDNSNAVNLYRNGNNYNRFNMGIGIGGGVKLNQFDVGIAYQAAFININGNKNQTTRLANLLLTASYFF